MIIGKEACILVALNYTKKTGWEVLQDDTLPTVYISDIAVRENVKHFIYISSTAVNDSLYMADASELREKFGGFNHTFYENVFELIFRLKGNYLWPAMWGRAFYVDDPLNPQLADEYGINSDRNRGWKGMGGFPLKTIRE